jgi:cytochrome c553
MLDQSQETRQMQKSIAFAAPFVFLATVAFSDSHATATAEDSFDLGEIGVLMEGEIDTEAAEKVFRKSCRGCHGNKGQGASSYPNIADLEPEYVAEKLIRYREGEKFGPNSVLMIQQAKKLSDEDIANLAIYVTTAFE